MQRPFYLSYVLFILLIAALGLPGCGVISPLRTGPTPTPGTAGGKLYVSTSNSIFRFGNALTATGNVAPSVIISGSSSQINSPKRILLDANTDRLFVANQGGGSVLIFSPASTASASSSPSAVLTSTGNMAAPSDLAIDPANNLLYVLDRNNILVFGGESSLNGNVNVPPARVISFVSSPAAIFLDSSSNTMFLADTANNSVDIIQSASTASGSGDLLIVGRIAGNLTNLTSPNGMLLDHGGRLVVSNGGSSASVLVFTNLLIPAGGNTSPSGTISGSSTLLASPGQMAINSNTGDLYVADNQTPGILVFSNIGAVNGNISSAPVRSFVGAGTQLTANAVNGVALDPGR